MFFDSGQTIGVTGFEITVLPQAGVKTIYVSLGENRVRVEAAYLLPFIEASFQGITHGAVLSAHFVPVHFRTAAVQVGASAEKGEKTKKKENPLDHSGQRVT